MASCASFVAVVTPGCTTTNELRVVTTISFVQDTVHNAMLAYGEAVAAGKVDQEDRYKVEEAYQTFELYEEQAIASIEFGRSLDTTVAPEDLAEAVGKLTELIAKLID